jgi:xanthine dehydrogenase accessory factor
MIDLVQQPFKGSETMSGQENLHQHLEGSQPKVRVEVIATNGSAPRESDAFMLVSDNAVTGTIGGGQLEFLSIDHARQMLAGLSVSPTLSIPLGPEIGQCCGGRVEIGFRLVDDSVREDLRQRLSAEKAKHKQVFVFGAGHVGRALAQALSPLPFAVTLVETRTDELTDLPETITPRLTAMPEALVRDIAPGGGVVILTHDHALDFLIAHEALKREDLRYVGMIGSATKRATFKHWLAREHGRDTLIDRLTLPIGNAVFPGPSLRDKRPEVIAALVAAELLVKVLGEF